MDRHDDIILHPKLNGLCHPAQVPSSVACSRCERRGHRELSAVRLTVAGITPKNNDRKLSYLTKVF